MSCECCGAPADGKTLLCAFCNKPVSAELLRSAIPCPRCATPNLAGAAGHERCTKCSAWLVVQCVFCSALSVYTAPACTACHETFAGAIERKAARDAEAARQREMQVISTVGAVAAPFLGAVAGSVLSGVFSHHASGDVNGSVFGGSSAPFGHVPSFTAGSDDGGSIFQSVTEAATGDSSGDGGIGDVAAALLGGGGDDPK